MRRSTLTHRLHAKKRNQAMIIGVVGYTAETWAQVKATATDPQCFEDSFEQWHKAAVAARREFLRSGVKAIEYQIDPAIFAAWCAEQQQENNATSRAEFVSVKLSEAYGQGSS